MFKIKFVYYYHNYQLRDNLIMADKDVKEILNNNVIVEEKVDGANMGNN